MIDQCSICPIRVGCDFLSGLCRLEPSEIARFRPDLIRSAETAKQRAQRRWREKNLEQCRKADRERYAQNRSSEIKRQIEYQKENPETRARAQRLYGQKHRPRLTKYRRDRRLLSRERDEARSDIVSV